MSRIYKIELAKPIAIIGVPGSTFLPIGSDNGRLNPCNYLIQLYTVNAH